MKKRISHLLDKKALLFGIIIGAILGILISFAITLCFDLRISRRIPILPPIAPYYDEKSFEEPGLTPSIPQPQEITKTPKKIPIIMYHYVEYNKNVDDLVRSKLTINPALFEAHLKTLQEHNYATYFVKDIPDILNGKIPYSTQSAVLTFDDGYEDFYTVVYPLLQKYHMKATEYVIYDYMGRKGFLTKDEVIELGKSDLVEIGAHTLDHVYLKKIPTLMARTQIFDSKTKLEDLIGHKVETFAYPYGAFSDDSLSLVKEASFSAAVSVIPGVYQSEDNLFYMNRLRAGLFSSHNMVQIIEKWKK